MKKNYLTSRRTNNFKHANMMMSVALNYTLPFATLFYFCFALPLCCPRSFIGTLFPKTRTHELAAATLTVLHTWFITLYGLVVLVFGMTTPENAAVIGGNVSLAYFVFDSLYLIWRERTRVIYNKYFGHHIIAIAFSFAAAHGELEHIARAMLFWYTLIEGSNVFLKLWDLSRHNHPTFYAWMTPYFAITYIKCRSVAVTYGTYNVWVSMSTPPAATEMPIQSKIMTMGLIAIVNTFSVWFAYRIVRMFVK